MQLLNESAHLNKTGLEQIVNIKASLNKGLTKSTEYVKANFTLIRPVPREIIETTEIASPYWIAGFISAATREKVTLMRGFGKRLKIEKNESI